MDHTSRWHGTPNHHWLWKLYTGPQATWISVPLLSSSRLWGPWFPKEMQNLLSSENITLDHSAAVQSFFVFRPDEMLLTLSVVQEWLYVTLKPMSCIRLCVVVLKHWLQLPVHSLWISPTFLNGFCFHNPLQGAVIPMLVHFFLPHLFFPSPSLLMCFGHRALWTSQPLLQWPFVSASLCKVSMVVFWDNCQVTQSSPWLLLAYRIDWETI